MLLNEDRDHNERKVWLWTRCLHGFQLPDSLSKLQPMPGKYFYYQNLECKIVELYWKLLLWKSEYISIILQS
jgi:hypothetical protein